MEAEISLDFEGLALTLTMLKTYILAVVLDNLYNYTVQYFLNVREELGFEQLGLVKIMIEPLG